MISQEHGDACENFVGVGVKCEVFLHRVSIRHTEWMSIAMGHGPIVEERLLEVVSQEGLATALKFQHHIREPVFNRSTFHLTLFRKEI